MGERPGYVQVSVDKSNCLDRTINSQTERYPIGSVETSDAVDAHGTRIGKGTPGVKTAIWSQRNAIDRTVAVS